MVQKAVKNGKTTPDLEGSVEENILTALVWNDELAKELALRLTPDVFSNAWYRQIATKAIDHIAEYNEAPGPHLRDLMERELSRGEHATLLDKCLNALQELAPHLQPDFVLDQFDNFVTIRQMRDSTRAADEALSKGDIETAREHHWSALQARPPSTRLADPWADPLPPEFSISILPRLLRRFVATRARISGCDPAGIAMAALSACSAALDGSIRLQMMENDSKWKVPPGLWVLLFGPSSVGRTPALDAAWDPLKAIQRHDIHEWQSAKKDWDKQDKAEREGEPRLRRLVTGNTTVEALQGILTKQDRGVAVFNDEYSGFIGGLEKYNSGRGASGADRSFHIKGFDGGSYPVDRSESGRGFVNIENLHLVHCGGIQPDKFRELGNLTTDGFLQRLLVIIMRKKGPSRDELHDGGDLVGYEALLRKLLEVEGNRLIKLSSPAHRIREDVENRIATWEENDLLGQAFQSHCGKLTGIWGRLTLVLGHIIQSNPSEIDIDAAEIAQTLLFDNLLKHSALFYEWLGGGSNVGLTQNIAGYILTRKKARLLPSDLQAAVRACRGMRLDQIQQALSPLTVMGWLEPEGERNARSWKIRQAVYSGQFDERAKIERFHRDQIRELIASEVERRR